MPHHTTEAGKSEKLGKRHAPNTATVQDFMMDSEDARTAYYKLKANKLRLEAAANSLTAEEKQAVQMSSDLDVLAVKILAKLKVKPELEINNLRAVTGMESREDIAMYLARQYFDKVTVDSVVKEYVDETKVKDILDASKAAQKSLDNANVGKAVKGTWGTLAGAAGTFGFTATP